MFIKSNQITTGPVLLPQHNTKLLPPLFYILRYYQSSRTPRPAPQKRDFFYCSRPLDAIYVPRCCTMHLFLVRMLLT